MDEATPRQAQQPVQELGPADLLVGILDPGPPTAAETGGVSRGASMLREALRKLGTPLRTLVFDGSLHEAGAVPEEQSPTESQAPNGASSGDFRILPAAMLGSDSNSPLQGIAAGYRRIFAVGQQVEAKACCVVASSVDSLTPGWFYWLAQPVLELGYDVVTPCYVHGPFEGLLNASIISPLHAALYGQNLQNPIGPDVGLSLQAVRRMNSHAKSAELPLVALAPGITGAGLNLCQAYVGRRVYPPTDWSALSSLLPPILSPIFSEVERNASIWQRVRGLRPVNTFGDAKDVAWEPEAFDSSRMIESFQLGIRDLREIYSLVLPPSTLLELTKLARLGADQFRMPDALWARIIYDFAASYHVRTINRDHLLRALTPLYLGWVASYALELQADRSAGVSPLTRLASAFESVKPYFVSRWRWPDRFNP